MNKRIKYLRKNILNITQLELGNRIGLTESMVSRIESGAAALTERNINLICREFNVNIIWLKEGEGEIFNEIHTSLIDRLAEEYKLNDIQIRMIEAILELSDDQINMFTSKFFGFEVIKKD